MGHAWRTEIDRGRTIAIRLPCPSTGLVRDHQTSNVVPAAELAGASPIGNEAAWHDRQNGVLCYRSREGSAMPLLTLKILAGILQLHGPEAQISSDNQGVDYLLASVREKLEDPASSFRKSSGDKLAVYDKFVPAPGYVKNYFKDGVWTTHIYKRELPPSPPKPTPTPPHGGPSRGGRH
jgi:hypothetical protein